MFVRERVAVIVLGALLFGAATVTVLVDADTW